MISKVYNKSSTKIIYPKSLIIIFILKKENYLGLINRRSGSRVDLWEYGKLVKIKDISQTLSVYSTSKITHENSGLSSFQVRRNDEDKI